MENRPPVIDWALTNPPEYEKSLTLAAEVTIPFSVEGAVIDPDGDEIEYLWYWILEGAPPVVMWGKDHSVLQNLCQITPLANAAGEADGQGTWIRVHVVVSDHPLEFTQQAEQPVIVDVDDEGNSLPLVERVWFVEVLGTCQQ